MGERGNTEGRVVCRQKVVDYLNRCLCFRQIVEKVSTAERFQAVTIDKGADRKQNVL
jgi:hypothetical protein